MLGAVLLAGLGGCSLIAGYDDPAIVGDWIGTSPQALAMSIQVEGTGTAKLHRATPSACDLFFRVDKKAGWEQRSDSKFTLPLNVEGCVASACSACADEDFTMTCDGVQVDDKSITCSGAGKWVGVSFVWRRK